MYFEVCILVIRQLPVYSVYFEQIFGGLNISVLNPR